MTELLDQAFAELSKLPELEQDAFAQQILDRLAAGMGPQDLLGTYADMFAELTLPYQSALPGLGQPTAPVGQGELKEMLKQALLELFTEQGGVLRDLLAEILRDAAQGQGMGTEPGD